MVEEGVGNDRTRNYFAGRIDQTLKKPFSDRIKFFIHKPSKTLAIDEQYHVDMENELIDEYVNLTV